MASRCADKCRGFVLKQKVDDIAVTSGCSRLKSVSYCGLPSQQQCQATSMGYCNQIDIQVSVNAKVGKSGVTQSNDHCSGNYIP